MSNVNGGTITVTVAGRDVGLSDLLARINQQMNASGTNARNYATQMAQIDPVLRRTDQQLARYAQSLASLAKAQGDTAGSQRILASAIGSITPATTSANQVMLQLQNSINQQAASAQKASFSFQGLAAGLQTLIGGYFVAARVVSTFAEAIGKGNELEKTLTTFRVLSGSAQAYETNLAAARRQQEIFGGSLQDTVEGMSAFANLSNRTGIEITKLTNLARALAIIDPVQGFKGAGIALKEFFSGDITSLARRFEIPRDALNGIKNIADEAERFAALEQVLAQYGITTELLASQANTTAVEYAKLGGAVQDSIATIGQFLGQTLLPAAQGLTVVAREVTSGFQNLLTVSDQLAGFTNKIFTDSTSVDEFNAKIRDTNAAIGEGDPIFGLLFGRLQELTPAQYQLAQSLVATGSSAQEAFAALEQNAGALDRIRSNIASASAWYGIGADTANQFAFALSQTAITTEEASGFAVGLAIAVANGLPVEQAMIALQQYKANALTLATQATAESTAATTEALSATQIFTQALTAEALEKANSQIVGDALKITQEQLYAAALAAAQGMGATAQSAAVLASQFGITTAEAYGLISALQQLEVAKAKQELGLGNAPTNGRGDNVLATPYQLQQQAAAAKLQRELKTVQDANALAAANTAGKLEIQRDRLSKLTKGTVEYEKQLGVVQAAERALQAEQDARAKKGGGAPKLTPNEKINTKLLDDQDKFNDKFEDAEQKHWDKVADIYEKFNEEQQKQFAKNEVSKRRSRADFYAGLQDAEGIDVTQFAAQYEEAFAKAQEIAASGKAKLANDFLELRQRQIEEMKQLEEEAAKIRQDRDEGKISEKDAQAQLEYLEGRKKLVEDAQREEQEQLLAAGDENQNRLNEQLAAEEEAYAASTEKIATSAERAAEAKIKHAERSKIAVTEENKVLAEQAGYYERIARVNGGVVPASQRGSPIPTSSGGTQGESGKPIDVAASSPLPITSAESILVRQTELFIVHDADVMSAIGDMAARLEGRLSEVVTAVNSAKDGISAAVNAVESAVGKIRVNTPSVVGN